MKSEFCITIPSCQTIVYESLCGWLISHTFERSVLSSKVTISISPQTVGRVNCPLSASCLHIMIGGNTLYKSDLNKLIRPPLLMEIQLKWIWGHWHPWQLSQGLPAGWEEPYFYNAVNIPPYFCYFPSSLSADIPR